MNKIHHVDSSKEGILDFASFCENIHQMAEWKKENHDIKIFTSILPTFLVMPDKTDNDQKEFFISYCKTFEPVFLSLHALSRDKNYAMNFLQTMKQNYCGNNSSNGTCHWKNNSEKIILKFLIFANHFYEIACKRFNCSAGNLLCSVSNKLVRLQSADEKIQEFQKYCRVHYKEFIELYCFLRKLAKKLRQNGIEKNAKRRIYKRK